MNIFSDIWSGIKNFFSPSTPAVPPAFGQANLLGNVPIQTIRESTPPSIQIGSDTAASTLKAVIPQSNLFDFYKASDVERKTYGGPSGPVTITQPKAGAQPTNPYSTFSTNDYYGSFRPTTPAPTPTVAPSGGGGGGQTTFAPPSPPVYTGPLPTFQPLAPKPGTPGTTGGGATISGAGGSNPVMGEGGAGGGGTPVGSSSSIGTGSANLTGTTISPEEDKRQRQERAKQLLQQQFPGAQILQNEVGQFFVRDQNGNTIPAEDASRQAGFSQFTGQQIQFTKEPFNAGSPAGTVDTNDVQNKLNQISSFLSTNKGAILTMDKTQGVNLLQSMTNYLTTLQKTVNPVPPNPVRDTSEQSQFLQTKPLNEQTTIKQQMDDARSKYGLPGLETGRINLLQRLNASMEAYNKIVDDIRNNPDLPRSLAERRINEFTRTNNIMIQNLKGQLDVVNQQINDANDAVNRDFNIAKLDQTERERKIDDNRAVLGLLISSQAIASATDQQLDKLASDSAIASDMLKTIRNSVKDKIGTLDNITSSVNDKGDVTFVGIDKSSGNIVNLGTIGGIGKSKETQQTSFVDRVIGGRLVRIVSEKGTGIEISRTDLGPSGSDSSTDLKSKFIQYTTTVPKDAKSRDQLELEARQAGVSPTDKDVSSAIDAAVAKNTGWFQKAWGAVFGK